MNNWGDSFYVFTSGAALLLSLVGQWFTAIMPGINCWNRRFFRGYFIILMLCCLSGILETALYYCPVPLQAIHFMMMLECLLLSLPLPMLTVYLLHCCGEDMRKSRLLFAVLSLMAVYAVLIAAAPFIGWYSYVLPDMRYIRRPVYPLLLSPVVVIMLLNLNGVLQRKKQLSRKLFSGFLIAMLPLTVVLIVQLFVDVFPLLYISIVLSALAMYSFVLSDQIEQDLAHQREIANQRANIMVLQMRPHFIYNTMSSIYFLCSQDPEKAQQVVMDFTTYLRKNFTAIASSEPIPFTAELEHTRAYLAVEKAQYEDSLFVDFDTPHTWFRLPPLTLQPIVENAVKHGRDPYAGPFHISVRTRKTADGSEIVVEDNGRGFQPADDNEPHTALENIRQRLELMCGGSLEITSKDGGGTIVTMRIPDNTSK